MRLLYLLPLFSLLQAGCMRSPSPLTPLGTGSLGLPHRGSLATGARLPQEGPHVKRLRDDDRAYAVARLVRSVETAADEVMTAWGGSKLVVGDFSREHGGILLPHLSHRSGRDADLLLYYTTLEGAPVEAPGFIHVEPDGLAWDTANSRFLRFDVAREWIFVRALLTNEQARIQWVFANHNVRALLLEWARARGESADIVARATLAMAEPKPGGLHDDHIHIRTACTDDELAGGCEASGPSRYWIAQRTDWSIDEGNAELASILAQPLQTASAVASQ